MKSAGARALEFAAIAAILALAGLQVWQGLGDPWREFNIVAAACAGLMGIAAGELAAGRAEPPPIAEAPEALLKEAMDRVLLGIRGYLEENLLYRDDLKGIDAGLSAGADPARARDAIAALRAVNQRMATKSGRPAGGREAGG